MGLFSLIAVLLIEQIRPLPYLLLVREPLLSLGRFLENRLNAGERSHGVIAWFIGVGGLVLIAGGVHAVLVSFSPLVAWLWSVLILYLAMGFRQFSEYYSEIQLALRNDDLTEARRVLAVWRGCPGEELSSSEIARLAIEEALRTAHRHVFGVLICFIVLPGPCGAVLYRAAAFFAEFWGQRADADAGCFGKFSQQAFAVIDWLPLRLTAAGFAVVGNFESAIYCWRTQADNWPDSTPGNGLGIVLASAAGALGVRLGRPLDETGERADQGEMGVGGDADVDVMQSAVGLIWRALVLCLLLLLLFRVASLVGA